jgi:hypothetical protein
MISMHDIVVLAIDAVASVAACLWPSKNRQENQEFINRYICALPSMLASVQSE